jgi:hypothetical protein
VTLACAAAAAPATAGIISAAPLRNSPLNFPIISRHASLVLTVAKKKRVKPDDTVQTTELRPTNSIKQSERLSTPAVLQWFDPFRFRSFWMRSPKPRFCQREVHPYPTSVKTVSF